MTSELEALRAVDFDWTMHLRSIWSDPPFDVPELHGQLRQELAAQLDSLQRDRTPSSPLGWILIGSGGGGKTHLLSYLRRETLARRIGFILVDMTDVHDFWETVLLGYLSSLQQTYAGDKFQHQVLLEHFIESLNPHEPLEKALHKIRSARTEKLSEHLNTIINFLGRRYPRETLLYQDVIRALVALNSHDFTTASIGLTWLNGHTIDDADRRALRFTAAQKSPREIVEALSWLMSLVGPTVLAFDQLDPIVAQLNIATSVPENESSLEEIVVARTIIEGIGRGFAALFDVTRRTQVVVSCLESTWSCLRDRMTLSTHLDRFTQPRTLYTINKPQLAESLLRSRLDPAYHAQGFSPPYPTWPFAPKLFSSVQGISPRALLKICDAHRRRCLEEGTIHELRELIAGPPGEPRPPIDPIDFSQLDEQFAAYRSEADLPYLLEEKEEDDRLAPILQAGFRALAEEAQLPPEVDPVVDTDFQGGKTTRALHARLRLVYHQENDREEHFCLRSLQRQHALAFQPRLKAAMTQAGIDRRLNFRRLVIVRTEEVPGGKVTGELLAQFEKAGGLLVKPTDDELRTLWALARLFAEKNPYLADWLRSRRPASALPLMQQTAPALCQARPTPQSGHAGNGQGTSPGSSSVNGGTNTQEGSTNGTGSRTTSDANVSGGTISQGKTTDPPIVSGNDHIPLGRRIHGTGSITMPLANLEKHTVILAGAGSGKTVLLRRLVEEAALLGTPAIVVDCANDLSALGERWPATPDGWHEEDPSTADRFHHQTEVIVWTPGRDRGNPLMLEPLPDLAAMADDEDQLQEAIDMARESLRPMVAPGKTQAADKKVGLLSSTLRFFAKHGGGTLHDFVELLRDLPPEAGLGIRNESRLARDMGDALAVQIATNPLLRGTGQGLDPALLFGDVPGSSKVRISVINLMGLQSPEMQQQFLNQLAMTLFSWIKKNPSPPGRTLRGLLAIDEAKDFVPSQKASACKPSLMRLTAQARKYHLGLIFATQQPREIDNALVGNCSTHYYGKANSPAAIDTIRDQISLRGGSGNDVATLERGSFYVYNADAELRAPTKVRVPMCLSHHRKNPLADEEILALAEVGRKQIAARATVQPAP